MSRLAKGARVWSAGRGMGEVRLLAALLVAVFFAGIVATFDSADAAQSNHCVCCSQPDLCRSMDGKGDGCF